MSVDLVSPFGMPVGEKVLQCPACEAWQLHYDLGVVFQWAPMEFEEVIESILREHVALECPHPRVIHELLKGGGKLAL